MKNSFLFFIKLSSVLPSVASDHERSEWGAFFKQFPAQGTIVVVDQRVNDASALVFNKERALKRFSPAPTN